MFKKFFKKKDTQPVNNEDVLITALLIHAAKIDENYTEVEKNLIKKAIMDLNSISSDEAEKLMLKAEEIEKQSNQIVGFTREIKKKPMKFRLKVIEILWKIVYSDGTSDIFESNLIRRVCGLLYISDKDSGELKLKLKTKQNKI